MTIGSENPLTAAVYFLQGTLAGSVAAVAAVLAVAGIGLLMLSGRIDVRRSAMVILGCFILFGAAKIAAGFEGAIFRNHEPADSAETAPFSESSIPSPTPKPSAAIYDPYAGAAVPRQ
jgi:type IV secretory pathway VirB2 component (pilin)